MRLFFALWPALSEARNLAALAQGAARRWGGRATRAETLHLTLAFLGEVASDRLPLAKEAADGVAASAFDLCLDQLGYWKHNRLLWAGCSRTEKALQELVSSLSGRLRERDFPLESRSFVPHVTLVRKMPQAPDSLDFAGSRWPCREFMLIQSVSSPRGVDYKKLASWKIDP